MEHFMEWMRLNWGWVLSFGGVCGGLILYFYKRLSALEKGVQALLRNQMITNYNHYLEKGFAPIYAKENFENMWIQYEALGKNGVMKKTHDDFMSLPTNPPEQKGD